MVRRAVAALFPVVTEELAPPPVVPDGEIAPGVSLGELRRACGKMKEHTAPGPDGIPNVALRIAVAARPDIFLRVYTACIRSGVFPRCWKRQRLVLLPKPGKPPDEPTSFRPICMLDAMGKMLERIICDRLQAFTQSPAGLSDRQFGFRRGRSTIDATETVVSTAREALKGKRWLGGTKEYCAVVTLDVKNAFNTARWNNILTALERIETPAYLRKIIANYFQDRVLEFDTSDGPEVGSVTAGVPQGSVLGPTLWNVMYDAILRLNLQRGVNIVGFADDIALVAVDKYLWRIENHLNAAVGQVREALLRLGLETADQKTEVLLLTSRKKMESITITVGNCHIKSAPHIRYLGLHIDARLRFDVHLAKASEKARSLAGALASIMPRTGGPRSSRRKLYAGVVDSVLLYGAPIWSSATETRAHLRRAESIHRRACLRIISGRPHLSYEATYVLASIPPLALLADERARLFHRSRDDAGRGDERQETLRRWQVQWDQSTKGRWTHRLVPDIKEWVERRHGEMSYYLTQLMTGHGYFRHHSQRYDNNASARYPVCPDETENVEHIFFHCSRFEPEREVLQAQIGERTEPENIVRLMLRDRPNWNAVSNFAKTVITRLRQEANVQQDQGR
uniref:Reverse transcriptase domain-containing protein n=1 Tax=Trichogramma kaykai TaxID=54128 RepID=A0ABD2WM31_9HYME